MIVLSTPGQSEKGPLAVIAAMLTRQLNVSGSAYSGQLTISRVVPPPFSQALVGSSSDLKRRKLIAPILVNQEFIFVLQFHCLVTSQNEMLESNLVTRWLTAK
ncbi:hypothetical protein ACSFA3_21960 [Variovorax sp. RHLX14]|uniref:hypothetical protein n=1 Tax=Variovorax sp. RHLX14 TaxID=1259731 RepID=UPI003F469F31